jgi:hypothetical protein
VLEKNYFFVSNLMQDLFHRLKNSEDKLKRVGSARKGHWEIINEN